MSEPQRLGVPTPPTSSQQGHERRQVRKGFIPKETWVCQVASIYWLQGPEALVQRGAGAGAATSSALGTGSAGDKGTSLLAPGPTSLWG